MGNTKEEKPGDPIADMAYGLLIVFDAESIEKMKEALMARARERVEVGVRWLDVEHHYTFREFFDRLGFQGLE